MALHRSGAPCVRHATLGQSLSKMGQLPAQAVRATDFMGVPRAVVALARDLPPAHEIDWHSHPRFQLVYAARGVMSVDTREATWVVPPQRAVWMPPRVEHRLTAKGVVQLRSLYVQPDAAGRMPASCEVLEVTPLLASSSCARPSCRANTTCAVRRGG